MKKSKEILELESQIKDMQEVYDDPDTSQDIKNSIGPSLQTAKSLLAKAEAAIKQSEQAASQVKAVPKSMPVSAKKKRERKKEQSVKTVKTISAEIKKKAPKYKRLIIKGKAELTKIKNRTARGKESDAQRKALPPGNRISQSGKPYFESRENRADINRKTQPYLEKGGKTTGTSDYENIPNDKIRIRVVGPSINIETQQEYKRLVNAIVQLLRSEYIGHKKEADVVNNVTEQILDDRLQIVDEINEAQRKRVVERLAVPIIMIAQGLKDLPERFEGGGDLKEKSVNVYGYETRHLPASLVTRFQGAMDNIETLTDKEDAYYHTLKTNLKFFAEYLDKAFMLIMTQGLQNRLTLTTLMLAAQYNVKSALHIGNPAISDAINEVIYKGGKMASGGQVGSDEIEDYVMERLKEKGVDVKAFQVLRGHARWDLYYGPLGTNEDYPGFTTALDKLKEDLSKADIPDTLYYDRESGNVSESLPDEYYEDEETGEMIQEGGEWHEINTNKEILGKLSEYMQHGGMPGSANAGKPERTTINSTKYAMASGGRIKSAIKRDRAYKSDEPWERSYHRQTSPKNPRYSLADGGKTEGAIIVYPGYTLSKNSEIVLDTYNSRNHDVFFEEIAVDFGPGFYFTKNKKLATEFFNGLYKADVIDDPTVVQVKLKMDNALDFNKYLKAVRLLEANSKLKPAKRKRVSDIYSETGIRDLNEWSLYQKIYGMMDDDNQSSDITPLVKKAGYDGLIGPSEEYVVFEPEQIELLPNKESKKGNLSKSSKKNMTIKAWPGPPFNETYDYDVSELYKEKGENAYVQMVEGQFGWAIYFTVNAKEANSFAALLKRNNITSTVQPKQFELQLGKVADFEKFEEIKAEMPDEDDDDFATSQIKILKKYGLTRPEYKEMEELYDLGDDSFFGQAVASETEKAGYNSMKYLDMYVVFNKSQVNAIKGKSSNKKGNDKIYKKGGKVSADSKASFDDKVKAIAKNLQGKRVPYQYQKQYGETFTAKTATIAAKKIAGAAKKGPAEKKKVKAFLGMTLINAPDNLSIVHDMVGF